MIGPELGYTQPGMTIVCGDSHTATHGAFGALAFGIGTSEVEHVLATQTLLQSKPKTLELRVDGRLRRGVTAKDLILYLIGQITTQRRHGLLHRVHGRSDPRLDDGRADDRLQHVDRGRRPGRPDRAGRHDVSTTCAAAPSPRRISRRPSTLADSCRPTRARSTIASVSTPPTSQPQVTWGTNPGQVTRVDGRCPTRPISRTRRAKAAAQALEYMGLKPGMPIDAIRLDRVFIGSCTNARIEDLRAAAAVVSGHSVADGVNAMVVPGSGLVKHQAEKKGSTASSARPASNGARPAAACAWR